MTEGEKFALKRRLKDRYAYDKRRVYEIAEEEIDRMKTTPISTAEYNSFAEWVAEEIFAPEWEYNKDAFAEIACRKLAKLGIVKADGDKWVLVRGGE